MATPGAFNGTDVFIRLQTGGRWLAIGGQTSHTETLNNGVIDITNKIGNPSYRELLADEGTQSIDYGVEFVFNSDAAFLALRDLANSKAQARFQVIAGDVAADGFVTRELTLQVNTFADTSPDGDKLTASVSLQSSDEFSKGDITYSRLLVSNGDNLLESNSDRLLVRS